mgnify:FL=1
MGWFRGRRQYSVLMFTDIRGYSALIQRDEALGLELLDTHRRLVRTAYGSFGAREIKTMGDGFLIVFASPGDAVNCAIQIQRNHRNYNADQEPPRRIHVRIGIHAGQVELRRRDVFGDDVNIAARVERLSLPGGMCLTGSVAEAVQGRLDFSVKSIGFHRLKNIAHPVELFAVDLPWLTPSRDTESYDRTRLAVLPFIDISSETDSEYFADGVTEELIYRLALVRGLRVIAQTSVARYKGSDKRLATIAGELRVGTVLEGSIRKSGETVRITAQLIDAATEEHLWAKRYDFELSDIFSVQTEIAELVAAELEVVLSSAEKSAISREPTSSVEAHSLYLQGKHFLNKRVGDSVERALRRFRKAVEADPTFALAHAGIADAYSLLPQSGRMEFEEAHELAEAAARRAIEHGPELAAGYASLAFVLLHRRKDMDEAERLLATALDLSPDDATIEYYQGVLATERLRMRDSAASLRRAVDLDPLSPIYVVNAAMTLALCGAAAEAESYFGRAMELGENPVTLSYYASYLVFTGRAAQALEYVDHALTIDPTFTFALECRVRALLALGRPDEAVEVLDALDAQLVDEDVITRFGSSAQQALAFRAVAEARLDHAERARELARDLEAFPDRTNKAPHLAAVHVALGEHELALDWLDLAYEMTDPLLHALKVYELYEPIREHPRVQALLSRMQLDSPSSAETG